MPRVTRLPTRASERRVLPVTFLPDPVPWPDGSGPDPQAALEGLRRPRGSRRAVRALVRFLRSPLASPRAAPLPQTRRPAGHIQCPAPAADGSCASAGALRLPDPAPGCPASTATPRVTRSPPPEVPPPCRPVPRGPAATPRLACGPGTPSPQASPGDLPQTPGAWGSRGAALAASTRNGEPPPAAGPPLGSQPPRRSLANPTPHSILANRSWSPDDRRRLCPIVS